MARPEAHVSELLGVAVLGLGVGEQHARAFSRRPDCRLRWVLDLDAAKMERLTAELGQGKPAPSYEHILSDPDVHIVAIATYDDAHADQVVAALRAGKHVFCEKPLCRSSEELALIGQTWEAAGTLHLASNLVLRAAPVFRWLKSAIEAGELGDVYAFDGDYLYGRIEKITEGWRRDVPEYSVIQGGGIHLIDLMLWLTGQKPTTARSLGNRICTRGSAFRYDDFVACNYGFHSGLVGRITANFGCVHPHQHTIRVFGTCGTFVRDDLGPRFFTSRDKVAAPRKLDLEPLPATKGDLIPAFVDAIRANVDPGPQARHEFDVMQTCFAADRSLSQDQIVGV
jgi:predicted dehydrogenase